MIYKELIHEQLNPIVVNRTVAWVELCRGHLYLHLGPAEKPAPHNFGC